jgi:hypothetical protein
MTPLEPVPVGDPPGSVAVGHVVARPSHADGAVDQLAHDVGVPGVTVGLGDHVHEDAVQGGAGHACLDAPAGGVDIGPDDFDMDRRR